MSIHTRTIRPTGETLTVGTAVELGVDPEAGKWVTICDDHHTIANSATQALAYKATGQDFCDGCRTRIRSNPTNAKVNFRDQRQARAYTAGARDAYDLLVTILEEGGDVLEGIRNNASADVVARLAALATPLGKTFPAGTFEIELDEHGYSKIHKAGCKDLRDGETIESTDPMHAHEEFWPEGGPFETEAEMLRDMAPCAVAIYKKG